MKILFLGKLRGLHRYSRFEAYPKAYHRVSGHLSPTQLDSKMNFSPALMTDSGVTQTEFHLLGFVSPKAN